MHKKRLTAVLAAVLGGALFAQTNNSVPLSDAIYGVIEQLQIRRLFPLLPGAKPYSERQIAGNFRELLATPEQAERLSGTEIEIIETFLERFDTQQPFWQRGKLHFCTHEDTPKVLFDIGITAETHASAGLYNDTKEIGWDIMSTATAGGMFWNNLSASLSLFGLLVHTPLEYLPEAQLAPQYWDWWYGTPANGAAKRPIYQSYMNNAYFPYAFRKKWDGSVYFSSNVTASGLEGWPINPAGGFGMYGELGMAFFDNRLTLRVGRLHREWAAMEKGASMVLNSGAHPFVGGEFSFTLFNWLSFSSLFGSLEMANAGHITGRPHWKQTENASIFAEKQTGSAFQNMFAINMLEANFKYVHIDFGTTVILPKRFEVGYLFPLMSKLFYQNNVGDFDNIGLFGNIKFNIPKFGSIWGSLFLDEFPGSKGTSSPKRFFISTRNMYAFQFGATARIPRVPFGKISVRYTKLEPYAYTHHAINYTPWYGQYLSEAYMNGGVPLGYYLPPNSDEVLVRFEAVPAVNLPIHVQYQFIRHGAEHGSKAVPGSSLYSELNPDNRDDARKYFLRDGAYQWIHVVKFGAEYNFKKLMRFPLTLYGEAGFVYSYYTDNGAPVGEEGGITIIDTPEYPTRFGGVLTFGVKIFY